MKEILAIYILSICLCAMIDTGHFIRKNITNVPFGVFLILCPVLNIIYSIYILIKYFTWDLKEFL